MMRAQEASSVITPEVESGATQQAAAPGRLPPQDILYLSSVDWDFLWQTNQSLAVSLAQQGYRVLFIENTGIRSARPRDVARLGHRLKNWLKSTKGFREVVVGKLYVYSPLLLPFPYSRLARWINRRMLYRSLSRWMRVCDFHAEIFLTYLPSPLSLDLIDDFRPELVIYYCKDNFGANTVFSKQVAKTETTLLRLADLVFVTAKTLAQKCRAQNPRVYEFPAGVDTAIFSQSQPVPASLQPLPRPLVGFSGAMHPNKFDMDLMQEVIRLRPSYSFVFVGTAHMDLEPLTRFPNVTWLQSLPHDQLPAYLQAFDACLIPYHLNDYTRAIFPAKFPEYLGAGCPVVTTPLPELSAINGRLKGSLFIAHGALEFADALDQAIAAKADALKRQRLAIAAEYAWSIRMDRIVDLIETSITEKRRSGNQSWRQRLLAIYDRTRRLMVRFALGVVLGYLMLFQTPLPWQVSSVLRVAQAPQPADAIVVLAGGVGESGQAGQGYEERVKYAAELYAAGYAKRLVFSSGYVYAFNEPDVMKALAIFLGVPEQAISLETASRNTYQQIHNVKTMLDEHHIGRTVLMISSPYHMRRVSLVARHLDPSWNVVCTPVPNSLFYDHKHGTELKHLKALCHEWIAVFFYWFKGYL